MKQSYRFLISLAAILTANLACAQNAMQATPAGPTMTPTAASAKVTLSDPAQVIKVQSSSPIFVINLKSNRTTGYSWFVKKIDHQLVKVVNHTYVPPQQGMPGEGGYEEWTFMAKPAAFTSPKTTVVKLIYARPWEKKAVKEETFKITTY